MRCLCTPARVLAVSGGGGRGLAIPASRRRSFWELFTPAVGEGALGDVLASILLRDVAHHEAILNDVDLRGTRFAEFRLSPPLDA